MLKTLIQTKLPAYISKKRLIINFISLYFRTLLSAFNSGPERRTIIFNNNSSQIPSGVWGEFTKIFKIYFKWIAIKYLLKANKLDSTNGEFHAELAHCLSFIEIGKYDEAIKHYNLAYKFDSTYVWCLKAINRCELLKKQYKSEIPR